jgi:predicted PurR-regulated permease PerM
LAYGHVLDGSVSAGFEQHSEVCWRLPRVLGSVSIAQMSQSPTSASAQILTGTAAAVALLYFLASIIIPFVIAFILAVLVNALVRLIQNRWAAAPGWAVSLLAGLVVIVTASSGIFIMAQGAAQMVSEGPALLARLDEITVQTGQSLHLQEPLHIASVVGKISVADVAKFLLSGMQGLFSGLLLMVVYFGFMLAGRKRIAAKVEKAAGSSSTTIKTTIERIAADIETYVWVQTITGLILTASATAVMLVVGLHNLLFWAVIFFLLTFIPNIGVTIGSVAPSLFALVQFPTMWQALTIFVVIQIVATVVGNLLYPRLQARTQNIDPVATLLSLAFWSWLWGLPGAFLAVPMTLMSMMVFSQFPSTKWAAAMLSDDGNPIFHQHGENPPKGS